jgi:hypothetical protein
VNNPWQPDDLSSVTTPESVMSLLYCVMATSVPKLGGGCVVV